MPKDSDEEKKARAAAVEAATIYATEVPLLVMETACDSMEVMMAMAKHGLQNSLSDAGVGALCARTAVYGAYFNVRINAKDIKNRETAEALLAIAKSIFEQAIATENEMIAYINEKI